jgi:hypothetical protein
MCQALCEALKTQRLLFGGFLLLFVYFYLFIYLFLVWVFWDARGTQTRSHNIAQAVPELCVAQAVFKLEIFLPQPPKC